MLSFFEMNMLLEEKNDPVILLQRAYEQTLREENIDLASDIYMVLREDVIGKLTSWGKKLVGMSDEPSKYLLKKAAANAPPKLATKIDQIINSQRPKSDPLEIDPTTPAPRKIRSTDRVPRLAAATGADWQRTTPHPFDRRDAINTPVKARYRLTDTALNKLKTLMPEKVFNILDRQVKNKSVEKEIFIREINKLLNHYVKNHEESERLKELILSNANLTEPFPEQEHGNILRFPPVGSKLKDRLEWVLMLEEKNKNFRLSQEIINISIANNYKPKTIKIDSKTWAEIKTDPRGFQPKESKLANTINIYKIHVLESISNNKMPARSLAELIDTLAHETKKIARLRGDELQYLAELWLNESGKWNPKSPPRLTQYIVNKMLDRFGDQRYFGETVNR